MIETPETTLQATQTQNQTMDPGMEPGQLELHRDCSTCSVWAQNQLANPHNTKQLNTYRSGDL